MKPKYLVYLFLFAIAVVCLGGSIPDAASEDLPIAYVPEDTYEFETVPEGTQVTHEFKIQNKGTAPLRIEKVRTG